MMPQRQQGESVVISQARTRRPRRLARRATRLSARLLKTTYVISAFFHTSNCTRTDPQQANRASSEAKKAEADLRAYSQQAQNKAQEVSREAQNKAQEYSAEAQAKYNSLSVEAKKKWDEARVRGEEFTRETSKDFNAAVNKFDKEVTKDAAQAKSWLGSWFGGK